MALQVGDKVQYNGKAAVVGQIIIHPTEHGLTATQMTEDKIKSVEVLIKQGENEFRVPLSSLA